MSRDIRRFIQDCDVCGEATAWQNKHKGFLKPLFVPENIRGEITINFITELSPLKGCTTIRIITDRLRKSKSYEAVKEEGLTAEESAV